VSNIEDYLYIDYENVQDVQVEVIKKTVKVAIIVGQDQTKVPIDLVQKTQPFGSAVEWIQVSGKGRNALDFFIAFFLGRDVAIDRGKSFIIYSKDTGYDPLINYLKKSGIKARRIVSFQELDQNTPIEIDEAGVKKVRESLGKLAANKRPKKRSSRSVTLKLAAAETGAGACENEKISSIQAMTANQLSKRQIAFLSHARLKPVSFFRRT